MFVSTSSVVVGSDVEAESGAEARGSVTVAPGVNRGESAQLKGAKQPIASRQNAPQQAVLLNLLVPLTSCTL